jgi:hypothetical protein
LTGSGVASRASSILPAFYTHLGAVALISDQQTRSYNDRVQVEYARFSALTTMSLACRAIFDDAPKGLTAKSFAQAAPEVIEQVAVRWSRNAKTDVEEPRKALSLLRQLFTHCAHQPRTLLKMSSLLARRVGLLTYHADHEAAHISLESYLFDVADLVHVVAAIAVVGAIITDFDTVNKVEAYFDAIDQAAWEAAKSRFPQLPIGRLFNRFRIHDQGRLYWKVEELDGLNMLLNGLPAAIGYWDSTPDPRLT